MVVCQVSVKASRIFSLNHITTRIYNANHQYVTDTLWSEAVRPGLLRLAHRAQRLYCDSYYSQAQVKQAATHRHMTAAQAAEFAGLARVESLILMHFAPRYA